MDKIVEKVIPLLESEGIKYYVYGSKVRVTLPSNFGDMEISDLDDNDTIIGLVGDAFHTHGDVLRGEYGVSSDEEAILSFIKDIFNGKCYLIEERENGVLIRKCIEGDLDNYYKYLPGTVEATVVSGT
jgi:hypothetical protein